MSNAEESVQTFLRGNPFDVITSGLHGKQPTDVSAMSLEELMDGPIRNKLGIIPDDVRFGGKKLRHTNICSTA